MKRKRRIVRLAWIMLICFITGQTVVYSHQHLANIKTSLTGSIKTPQPTSTITEKCNICDMMHHTHMVIFNTAAINPPVTICETHYTRQHDYTFIGLILASGRAPPIV